MKVPQGMLSAQREIGFHSLRTHPEHRLQARGRVQVGLTKPFTSRSSGINIDPSIGFDFSPNPAHQFDQRNHHRHQDD